MMMMMMINTCKNVRKKNLCVCDSQKKIIKYGEDKQDDSPHFEEEELPRGRGLHVHEFFDINGLLPMSQHAFHMSHSDHTDHHISWYRTLFTKKKKKVSTRHNIASYKM